MSMAGLSIAPFFILFTSNNMYTNGLHPWQNVWLMEMLGETPCTQAFIAWSGKAEKHHDPLMSCNLDFKGTIHGESACHDLQPRAVHGVTSFMDKVHFRLTFFLIYILEWIRYLTPNYVFLQFQPIMYVCM